MNDNDGPVFEAGENGITIDTPQDQTPREQHGEVTPEQPVKKPKKTVGRILKAVIPIVLFVVLVIVAFNLDYTAIIDNISSMGYEMTPEFEEIANDLDLTEEGERILRATHSELQDAEDFNNSCPNHEEGEMTLGCYSNGRIYVYNITKKEVEGVRQVALAHELLHAVWGRMSNSEKESLKASLKEMYDADEDVRAHMELYSIDDTYDEIHSVVGSQISIEKMPEDLRKHYERYFRNQPEIAKMYDGYNTIVKTIKNHSEELNKEITKRREELQKLQNDYTTENDKLSQDIDEFNRRSRDEGFTTLDEYSKQRASLVTRQNNMREKYNTIITKIDEINKIIQEYNDNIESLNEIQRSMNSKAIDPIEKQESEDKI